VSGDGTMGWLRAALDVIGDVADLFIPGLDLCGTAPVLGYQRSIVIAREALKTGSSVYKLLLQKGWLTRERLDHLLTAET
jgi:hypothetical protein